MENFFIKSGGKYHRINFDDIIYVEGRRNYLKIVTIHQCYMVLIRMKRLKELLPSTLFLRIHKSYIVALDKVLSFDSRTVCLKNIELPLGEMYKHELEKSVTIASCESGVLLPMQGVHRKNQAMAG